MGVHKVLVVVWILAFGVIVTATLLAVLIFGGYKGAKLGGYLVWYPNKQADEYRDLVREFTGTLTENEVSGFYAGSDKNHIWLWTLNGLESFLVGDVLPALYRYNLCDAALRENGQQRIKPQLTSALILWSFNTHPGDYVQMRYFYDEIHGKTRLVDKAWAYDADLWMEDTIERQCGRL